MSVTRYEKQLRRRQRDARRAVSQAQKAERKHVCPDCDTEYELASHKTFAHRPGPCGCPAYVRQEMRSFFEARSNEFAETDKTPCRNCRRPNTADDQASVFIEGRLIWDGCNYCLEHEKLYVLTQVEKAQMSWDGRKNADYVRVTAAHDKFIAPFVHGQALVSTAVAPVSQIHIVSNAAKATIASKVDPLSLYQQSVQNPDSDILMIEEVFMELRGVTPLTVREDFCAAGNTACVWVGSGKDRRSIGVDFDAPTVEWGKTHTLVKLPAGARARMSYIVADVRDKENGGQAHPEVDVILAQNFSYFIFKKRDELIRYFALCRERLNDRGVLFIDAFGGPEMLGPVMEETQLENFVYVWDQARFDPFTNEIMCHIHFKFADGSELRRAFTYDWRYWTVPELREMLAEAGFSKSVLFVDESDEDEDTRYVQREHALDDDSWTVVIAAVK